MRLYWGDYSRKTRHLKKAAEHGAYLLLIGALWDADGRLPADDQTLAQHALCTPKEWAALRPRIMPFFKIVRGHLTNKRVTEELEKYHGISGKRKTAGKAGGQARGGKHNENGEAFAKQKPTQTEAEARREGKEPSLSGAAKPARERASQRRPETEIPDGYPDAAAIAEAEGWAGAAGVRLEVAARARRFANHARTKQRRERNWPAAWRAWVDIEIESAPPVTPGARPAKVSWLGPRDVWDAVVASRPAGDGEGFAISWLAPCRWADAERRLVATSRLVFDKLKAECASVLSDAGVELCLEQERAA